MEVLIIISRYAETGILPIKAGKRWPATGEQGTGWW